MNQGVNAVPTSGQASPYTLFGYNLNGMQSYRERRLATGGAVQSLWFWWDGADGMRKVTDINDPADPTPFFTATYNGAGIRTKKNVGVTQLDQ